MSSALLLLLLLLLVGSVGATVPAVPDNVSVIQLRANSALVTWSVPQGDTVIGFSILQQRQDGLMQRSIREVNTLSHWCVLWDLDEDTHYSVQVQSVGRHGDSPPGRAVHFRTLEKSENPAVLEQRGVAMEELRLHLQTGELLIITTVLLLWAGVIALFCRQYDIIRDSESTITKEKTKRTAPFDHTAASSAAFQNGAAPSSRTTPLAPTFHLPPENV